MEFATPQDAAHAIAAMNGHPFDAKHTFSVNMFTDIDKYTELDETFVEPKLQEYKSKASTADYSWRRCY
jgi:translation initiation factor 3 subunit B